MSYDLAVWDGSAPTSDADALAIYQRLINEWHHRDIDRLEDFQRRSRGETTETSPTSAIAEYVDALLSRWPDITHPDGEDSPWSDGPLMNNAAGPLFYFGMVFSRAEDTVAYAASLAEQHGLVCFDPQRERLLTAASQSSQSEPPRRRWFRRN